jgi:hypothetical protein
MTITQTAASDHNLLSITPKQYEDHLAASFSVGSSLFILGRRGTGKTKIAKQEILKAGMHEVYVNLSVLERVDLGGMPKVFGSTDKFVEYLLPKFFSLLIEGDKPAILLLDEADKADASLQAPLLELVQFKTINGIPLPNLRCVVMTGNLISEGSRRPIQPLLDRVEKYKLETKIQDFLNWAAISRKIHPSCSAYLNDHPNHLIGAEDSGDNYGDPSPREWENFSRLLFEGEVQGWDTDLMAEKASGCLGKQVGISYLVYYHWYQKLLPTIDHLFKGYNVSADFNVLDRAEQFVFTTMVCARLATKLDKLAKPDHNNPPDELKTVGRFLQGVGKELVIASITNEIGTGRLFQWGLLRHKDWSFLKDMIEIIKGRR